MKPKPRPPSIRGPGAPLALQVAAMQGIQISTERQLQTSQLPQDHLINLPPAVPMQKLDSLEGYPGSLPALPPAKMPGCDFDHRNCQQRTQMAVAIASNPFGSSPGPLGDSPTNWMPHVPGAGVLIDRPTSRQHEARPASSPAAWRACRNPRPSSEQQTRKQRWSEEQGYTRQTRPGAQDPAQQLPGNADLHGQDPYQAAEVASGWGTWAEGSDFATVEKEQFLSTQKLLATDMDNARPGLLDSATASSKGALDPSSAFCGEIEFAEAEEGEKPSPEEKRAALSGRPRTRHNMAAKTIDLPSDDGEDQGNGNHSDIASSQPRNSTKENLSRKVTFYNRGTGDEDSERGEQRGGFLATMSSFFGGQSTRSLGGASTKSSARSVTHSAASRHSSTRSLANMASVMDDLPVPSVNPQHQSEDPEGAIMGGPSVMSMQSLFMDVDEALGEAQGTTSRMAEVSASYWAGGPVASLGSTTAAPPNPGDGEHDDRLTVSTQHYLLPGSTTGKT